MDFEDIQHKVQKIIGRPISCLKFTHESKERFLPLYLNFNEIGDESKFIGDSEQECFEKLYYYLLENKTAEES